MENLRLWEKYASEMMCSMIEQTIKQSDAFQRQMGENMEHLLTTWPLPTVSENHNGNSLNGHSQNGNHQDGGNQEKILEEQKPDVVETPAVEMEEPLPDTNESCKPEPVWTFRGYQLEGNNFTNAMVHFFRAETYRADIWRRRLDTTTNWAVITTGATLSLAWDPRVIILSTLLVTLFLFIEARRYRYYELWSYRVRLMETDFFAAMLVPPFRPAPDWAESLAENLLRPRFPISMWEAFGRRFRRNYVWIYTILWLAWLLSISLHPTTVTSWSEFMSRATIGTIPAWMVLLGGLLFNGALLLTGLLTRHLRDASGEVLPIDEEFSAPKQPNNNGTQRGWKIPGREAWFRPSNCRQQILAFVVTSKPKAIADSIHHEMNRGVTTLNGTGMYSDKAHAVLMCALTNTEVSRLKTLVSKADPSAFVMISNAQQVFGEGFVPLTE